MSVTKPGLSISVPPTRISAPSASSRGRHPAARRAPSRSACQARPPSCLISQAPKMLSAISSRIVHHGADHLADLDDHVDLDQRHDHERDDQHPGTQLRRRAAPSRSGSRAHGRRHEPRRTCSRALAQAPAGDPASATRWPPAPLILESPRTRSTNSIGTSRDPQPGLQACGRPCRSGRRSRWTRTESRSIFSSVRAPEQPEAGGGVAHRGCRAAAGRRGCRRARAPRGDRGQFTTRAAGDPARADHQVGVAQRVEQPVQLLGLVGAVGVHLADHVVARRRGRRAKPCRYAAPRPAFSVRCSDLDLRVGGGELVGDLAGAVGRAVVDDEDVDVRLRPRAAGPTIQARLSASL